MTAQRHTPLPQPVAMQMAAIRSGVQQAIQARRPPIKKTEPYKDSISETNHVISALRDQLDDANERIHRLEEEIGLSPETILPYMRLRFTPSETKFLNILLKRPNISRNALMDLLFADYVADADIPHPKIIDVHLCRLRSKLRGYSIHIETVYGGQLYMTNESKQLLRSLLEANAV
jgi:two-component system, cell cycle response regulator CtrA